MQSCSFEGIVYPSKQDVYRLTLLPAVAKTHPAAGCRENFVGETLLPVSNADAVLLL